MEMKDINQKDLKRQLKVPTTANVSGRNTADFVNNRGNVERLAALGARAKNRIAGFKNLIRIQDQQQAIQRYEWTGLPAGLDSQLLERMLYFRGVLAIWKDAVDGYQILPVAMTSKDKDNIDFYGRWKFVKPMPFNGKSDLEGHPYLGTVTRQAIWNEKGVDYAGREVTEDEAAVCLFDYTPQLSMSLIPRSMLQEPILESQAEILALERSALIQKSLPLLVRVDNQSMARSMEYEVDGVEYATFEGKWAIPFTDKVEGIDLKNQLRDRNMEDYWRAYESRDRLRREWLGLGNNGTFIKAAHTLQAEQDENAGSTEKILLDGLYQRMLWCKIVNAKFKDLTISVKVCETNKQEEGDANGDNDDITAGSNDTTNAGSVDK